MKSRSEKNKKLDQKIQKEKKQAKKTKRKSIFRKIILFFLNIVAIFFIYSRFIEPNLLLTHEIKLTNPNIEDFHGLKIVHFSDLHYGRGINLKKVKKLVTEINRLKPDIVIFTGDLIEDSYKLSLEEQEKLTQELTKIKVTYGKYAITGNHDYYNKDYNNIIYNSSFKLLTNDYDIIYNKNNEAILIYGFDNIIYGNPNFDKLKETETLKINYKIFILHEPDFTETILSKYEPNLILAGHSHNKQVNLPLVKAFWLPPESKIYYKPYYQLGNTSLYISNGIGCSSIRLRFLSVPSINFYRIEKE